MWRGSQIDITDVTYVWFKQVADAWEKITAANAQGIEGYNTNTITIPDTAVLNYATYKCDIKDTDTGSSTYNDVVSNTISFVDMSDPYTIVTECPQGDGIISGGSTKVKVHVLQGSKRMDASWFTGRTIKHFRFNTAGVFDNTWGDLGYKIANANRELTIEETDLNTGVQTAFGVELHG